MWVIRRKCSFHFLNFCSEFRNSLHLRCKMGRQYVFQKSRSCLFPGSTFYQSRNLRHSSIHELVKGGGFLPHIRENWSHALNWRFLLCRRVLAEITVISGSIFYCSPLIFFRLYLIKVRIGKLILWCFSSAEIWVQITLRLLMPKSFPVLGI